jgi:hypothetical protein
VAAVVPTVQLGGDWVIIEEDPTQLVVRWRDSGDGVRINLTRTATGREVGVAPIVGGRTAEVDLADRIVPMVRPSFSGLTAVYVEVQGPDLLVRLEGPPLSTLSDHPEAPRDPAIAWVRARPRGKTWRLALRGLLTLTVPAEGVVVHERVEDRILETRWGALELRSDTRDWSGARASATWTLDTGPSLSVHQPYPQLGITWTPDLAP